MVVTDLITNPYLRDVKIRNESTNQSHFDEMTGKHDMLTFLAYSFVSDYFHVSFLSVQYIYSVGGCAFPKASQKNKRQANEKQ